MHITPLPHSQAEWLYITSHSAGSNRGQVKETTLWKKILRNSYYRTYSEIHIVQLK